MYQNSGMQIPKADLNDIQLFWLGGFQPHCQRDRGICACGSIDLLLSWFGRYRTWRGDSTCRWLQSLPLIARYRWYRLRFQCARRLWNILKLLKLCEALNLWCFWMNLQCIHSDLRGPKDIFCWHDLLYVRSQLDGFCWNCRILLWMHQFCHPNVRRPWQQGNVYPDSGSSGAKWQGIFCMMFCHHLCVRRFKGVALIHLDPHEWISVKFPLLVCVFLWLECCSLVKFLCVLGVALFQARLEWGADTAWCLCPLHCFWCCQLCVLWCKNSISDHFEPATPVPSEPLPATCLCVGFTLQCTFISSPSSSSIGGKLCVCESMLTLVWIVEIWWVHEVSMAWNPKPLVENFAVRKHWRRTSKDQTIPGRSMP